MEDINVMPFKVFCAKMIDYLQLCDLVERVACPQMIRIRRDELEQELREVFYDSDDNINLWRIGKDCTYVNPDTHNRIDVPLRRDLEVLYQFLLFNREIQVNGQINDRRQIYLVYLLSRVR